MHRAQSNSQEYLSARAVAGVVLCISIGQLAVRDQIMGAFEQAEMFGLTTDAATPTKNLRNVVELIHLSDIQRPSSSLSGAVSLFGNVDVQMPSSPSLLESGDWFPDDSSEFTDD